jgi:mono/diheme cytochrome c family protein
MGKRSSLVAAAALAAFSVSAKSQQSAAGEGEASDLTAAQRSSASHDPAWQLQFLRENCVECHNSTDQSAAALFAGLFFDELNVGDVSRDPEVWEKVVRKLRTGMMPPADRPRPDAEQKELFLAYLETELDGLRAAQPNPGRPALHRVNRAEYANAIRDLLELEVDAAALLPSDDSSFGFDNIAGSLGVSPALLERYVSAAGKISRLAVGDLSADVKLDKYVVAADLTQNDHVPGMPIGTRGGMLVEHYFPLDAEYVIRADLIDRGGRIFGSNNARNEQLEVTLDGERVALVDLASYETDQGVQLRLPIEAGPHTIGAAFLKKNHAPFEDVLRPFEFSLFEPAIDPDPSWTFLPHMSSISITGPHNVRGVGDTPPRRRIFVCRPQDTADERACARRIVETLATRAFRQPVGVEQLSGLMDFFEQGRAKGSFDDGIEMALRRILASPEFVFRFERQPEGVAPGEPYRVDDVELASRLSFFLWSSIPDDELLDLAVRRRLGSPAVLRAQVERMLADPKSDALSENFAGQWLYLRNLAVKGGSVEHFPDFDDNLRDAFRTETEMFFDSVMREDRSVLEFLTADYTFVNERLAKHYGMSGVYGSRFRRVEHQNESRHGLLGQGSLLVVTSLPNRTSPVQRGVWVLENLIGAAVPIPPPNVPELEETAAHDSRPQTLRAQMDLHNSRPFCAGCHKIMDPVGFALENFDAVGRWRVEEHGEPIDAVAKLVDGSEVDGAAGLRRALLSYSDQFVHTLTEKLMTYALGRGLEHYDMPVVRRIARDAAADDYRFSSIVLGIVESEPFRMRIAEELPADDVRSSETIARRN